MSDDPVINRIRADGNKVAVVFIHGFSGNLGQTWGIFPSLLAAEPCLNGWDIFSLGYSTKLLPGVPFWTAPPAIEILAKLFQTHLGFGDLQRYSQVAILAHSMGGLVVQRALLDDPAIRGRTSHLFLFGTPSNGLGKASVFKFWTRQVRDLGRDSAFIMDLSNRRRAVFDNPSFEFATIAGETDNFVPPDSSLDPFDKRFHRAVPGNHLEIVKPVAATHLSVRVVIGTMCRQAAAGGPRDTARLAVEHGEFQHAILQFAGTTERLDAAALTRLAQELDAGAAVQLALALEESGRSGEALGLLELYYQQRQGADPKRVKTDPIGTLAGRLKRRWLLQGREEDGTRARDIYSQAYEIAKDDDDPQAFYMAINVAFMELALAQASPDAHRRSEEWAKKALDHTRRWADRDPQLAEGDKWRWATEGEAYLLLGDEQTALQRYRAAIARRPDPRELTSMYQQAYHIADLLYPPRADGSDPTADRLDALFREA
jgi:pimeloyl-ACP methyl ester carboxylesterase